MTPTSTAAPTAAPIAADSSAPRRILVWDAPVRVFHWLMVLCFFGAYVSAESERWRLVHNTLGYTMAGLVVFRLLWGLFGTRHARFNAFVRGPRAVRAYVASMLRGKPEHHAGHNPAGALAIIALLGLTVLVAVSGFASDNEFRGSWLLERIHEPVANLMLAVVLFHVSGVIVGSWLHRENLVAGMLSGRKSGTPGEAIQTGWRSVAALMLMAVMAFWWLQWQSRPQLHTTRGAQATQAVQVTQAMQTAHPAQMAPNTPAARSQEPRGDDDAGATNRQERQRRRDHN